MDCGGDDSVVLTIGLRALILGAGGGFGPREEGGFGADAAGGFGSIEIRELSGSEA